MAVPKKRTGASAQGHRRSNWKATVPETTTCPQCGELVLTHTVCTACGQYKGKVVSRKAEGFVENAQAEAPKKEAKAKKAPAKKAKKAEAVEEVKEEVQEEVKAQESVEEVTSEAEAPAQETTEEEKPSEE